METSNEKFTCPVCGYPELEEPPWANNLYPSFDICPSCGTEFGYHDAVGDTAEARAKTHHRLRQQWVKSGMPWKSKVELPPEGWNPKQQLEKLQERSS